MLKYLARPAANAVSIERIKKNDHKQKKIFEHLKKIEKVLRRSDKKNADTYTSIPNKL